jgi:hypothetical protein
VTKHKEKIGTQGLGLTTSKDQGGEKEPAKEADHKQVIKEQENQDSMELRTPSSESGPRRV